MSKHFRHGEFSCAATRCWHAPFVDLRGSCLWERFLDFARRFPDHVAEDNTHLYLAYAGDPEMSPPSWCLWWCCSHFEHTFREDLVQLVEFLESLRPFQEYPEHGAISVERLEEPYLHLKLYDPTQRVRDEVMTCGSELREFPNRLGESAAE